MGLVTLCNLPTSNNQKVQEKINKYIFGIKMYSVYQN